MLKVTIANIDQTYIGVIDTDDKEKAAEQAVASLKEDHGFFDVCYAFKTDQEGVWGIILNEGEEEELEWFKDHECTYTIWISAFKPGVMDPIC